MLVACSLFNDQPPGSVTTTLDRAAESIREVEGVKVVQVNVHAVGRQSDHAKPEAWMADLVITVEPTLADLNHVASAVEREIATANSTLSMMGTLYLPADSAGPAAGIEFAASRNLPGAKRVTAADLTTATQSLRTIDGVRDLLVSSDGRPATMSVESPGEWPRVAAALRALPGFGDGALAYATVETTYRIGMTLNPVSPTPALVDVLSSLASGPSVEGFSFSDVPPGEPQHVHGWRPQVSVHVSADAAAEAAVDRGTRAERGATPVETAEAEGTRVAEVLMQLDDAATQVDGIPRASFLVLAIAGGEPIYHDGFLGLPLGSAEPDDFVAPLSSGDEPPR